jgi:hypothetical protein
LHGAKRAHRVADLQVRGRAFDSPRTIVTSPTLR